MPTLNIPRVLLAAIALASAAFAQAPTYPLGRATSEDVIELDIVDRYALPVRDADVSVLWSRYGVKVDLDAPLGPGVGRADGLRTDAEGRVSLRAPRGEVVFATVSRSGYAPLSCYWLFAGWRYRSVLEIGATGSIVCVDAAGNPVAGARLAIVQQESAIGPRHLHGTGEIRTDGQGRAFLNFLDNGQYLARVRGLDGSLGALRFEISSQFGHETAWSLSDARIPLTPAETREIVVEDRFGDPIAGLAAESGSSALAADESVRVQVDGNRVHVSEFRPGSRATISLQAEGYESTRVEVGACTESPRRIVLAPRATDAFEIEIPPEERGDAVLIPKRMQEWSPWIRVPLDADGRATVRGVPRGVTYFGVVAREGRVRAYLRTNDANSKALLVRPAALDIAYRIDGHAPSGALVRIESASSIGYVANLRRMGSRIVPSDPDGAVRAFELPPDDYYLEPHFHGTVFSDSTSRLALAAGESRAVEVAVRRGRILRGRVVASETRAPMHGGFVTWSCADAELHHPVVELDADGRFAIAGLADEHTYEIAYHAAPWFDDFGEFGDGAEERAAGRVVSKSVPGSRTEELVVEVPESVLSPR